ncbi:unnamed protein product [Medioppia subpectinata]|uniref:Glycosyl transferase CAP10 domain-containing protein n=1 Tax=Medioppia subpectinata TaxID=1979941 RepID=A0A7R9KXH0_9ACAR|nr:unnamed protein product [Medioppia subpectinata]CAG2111313.1 unnamed protein product [Medioppia subpectinata]
MSETLETNTVSDTSCGHYLNFLDHDMSEWMRSGITKSAIDEAVDNKRGVHYQIIDHSLYRDTDCMFPSRCEGVEYFINNVIDSLPDMDLVVNVRDYPQVHQKWPDLPVLSFSKDVTQYKDVLYPAWTFWCGGPAIDHYPRGIGRWDLMRESITKNMVDWSNKSSIAFFRGSRTSHDRDPLIKLGRALPHLISAEYTANQAWRSVADTLGKEPVPTVTFQDHCLYKYLVNMRGVAASFRYKHLFLCKSVVLNVDSDWIEFFYPQLKPWIHFVPIAKDMSDLEEKIEFLKANDQIGRNIAEKGFEFIWHHLTMDSVQCYWKQLLDRYSKLMTYKPKLNTNLIKISLNK